MQLVLDTQHTPAAGMYVICLQLCRLMKENKADRYHNIGLSAVLWISIPAAASIVAPQRRKKKEDVIIDGAGDRGTTTI